MVRTARFVLLSACLLAACGKDVALTSSVALIDLRATPAVLQPGATVQLRPVFQSGTGRIDPDVGPVTSGASYSVGPFDRARQYTLTVTSGASTLTDVLDIPFTYRERVTQLTASVNARSDHGAVLLPSGSVMVVGGRSTGPQSNDSAELFSTSTFVHTPVGNLSTGRRDPALVVQFDGSVWSFGGQPNDPTLSVATVVEQWTSTPTPGWSALGVLRVSRQNHTATQLADGRILVLGGLVNGGLPEDAAGEIWTPAVGSRLPTVALPTHRESHSVTELGDGTLLIVGGRDGVTGATLSTFERWDPATESVVATGALVAARAAHAAVRLDDGRVLVIGGEANAITLRSAEIYDPVTGLFTATGDLVQAVSDVRAVALRSGEVLVAGGQVGTRSATAIMQAFSPVSGTFRVFGNGLPLPRSGHSLTLLPDSRVLLLGGDPGTDFPVSVAYWID